MPRADATELAPKKSAHQSPPAVPDSGAGGLFVFRQEQNKKACISLVKLPSGGSGLQNAKPARPLLPGTPKLLPRLFGILPAPTHVSILSRSFPSRCNRKRISLTIALETTLRRSKEKNVTRYTLRFRPQDSKDRVRKQFFRVTSKCLRP